LALLSVIARIAIYMGTAASIPVLRRKLPAGPETIRLPGGPAIPIAALLLCLTFLANVEARNLVLAAAALAIGAGFYVFRRRPAERAITTVD
jgi:amino acid transporter